MLEKINKNDVPSIRNRVKNEDLYNFCNEALLEFLKNEVDCVEVLGYPENYAPETIVNALQAAAWRNRNEENKKPAFICRRKERIFISDTKLWS